MATKTQVQESTAEVPFTSNTPSIITNYSAFVRTKLVPVEAICKNNWHHFRGHGVLGCHGKINLKTEVPGYDLIQHLLAGHDGGYIVKFRPVREGVWAGWKTLIDNGIEIANLNCCVCNQDVMVHPQHIAKHVKPHMNHRKKIERGGKFRVALSKDAPLPEDDLALMPETDFDFVDGFDG